MTNTDLKELVEESSAQYADENYFRRENSKWVPRDENGLRSLIERVRMQISYRSQQSNLLVLRLSDLESEYFPLPVHSPILGQCNRHFL